MNARRNCKVLLSSLGLSIAVGAAHASALPADPPTEAVTSRQATGSLARLPIAFEANEGQMDRAVRFLARGPGYVLSLTPGGSMLRLHAGGSARPTGTNAVIRMRLVGADAQASVAGLDRLPGTANYFIGDDPARWLSGVPTYAKVRYSEVYPGIDLVYYGNQQQLEYDFVVAAGADPRRIRVGFEGVDHLSLDREGNLVLATAGGNVVQHRPVVYQEIDGLRHAVAGRYKLHGKRRVGFEVGRYDRTRPLVIDPVLVYATYVGANDPDRAFVIAADASGNAYVAGHSYLGSFPTTPGAYQPIGTANLSSFVFKLNPAGTALVYSTFLSNGNDSTIGGIAVDGSGNAYLTGSTTGGFPTTPGAYQTTYGGGGSAFVTKLNAAGTALVYSTYLGGSVSDQGAGIAVDAGGNAYVTGSTVGSFPVTPGAYQTTIGGPHADVFVTKLNAGGTALVYSTYLGGYFFEAGSAIAVDGSGNAYVTGTADYTLPTTPGAFQTQTGGAHADAFVSKFNATGTALVYSTFVGGGGSDGGSAIVVDGAGNAYVTGATTPDLIPGGSGFPTTAGAYQTTFGGGPSDAFVTKLNASGSALVYSTYLGGSGDDTGTGVAVDLGGVAHVAGTTTGNFPVTGDAAQPLFGGAADGFVTQVNAAGTALAYSTYLGATGVDEIHGIALDGNSNAYVAGFTEGGFAVTPGAYQTNYGGLTDVLVARLGVRPNAGFDLNADGRSDLRWRNATSGEVQAWLMNGTSALTAATLIADPNWVAERTGDLNGDGRSDIVWRNLSTGETAIWLMNGTSFAGGAVILANAQWAVIHTGDFNGDGKSDLVWRNATTGQTSIWLMNGVAFAGGAQVLVSTQWVVTHVGDFNGDGKSDLVWRNATSGETAIWLMNGAGFAGGAAVLANTQWAVTHAGDFNGDGKSDLVWRNAATGQTAIWLMNGAGFAGGAVILANTQWAVTHVGDFNGDGKTDLLWRNASTGTTSMWLMSGTTMIGGAPLLTGSDWVVTRTDDYNGDGRSDLIWRHGITGDTAMWIMNGIAMTAGVAPLFVPSFAVE
jgi:hypothetical protein